MHKCLQNIRDNMANEISWLNVNYGFNTSYNMNHLHLASTILFCLFLTWRQQLLVYIVDTTVVINVLDLISIASIYQ